MGRRGACLPLGGWRRSVRDLTSANVRPRQRAACKEVREESLCEGGSDMASSLPRVGTMPRIPLEIGYLRQVEDRRTYSLRTAIRRRRRTIEGFDS